MNAGPVTPQKNVEPKRKEKVGILWICLMMYIFKKWRQCGDFNLAMMSMSRLDGKKGSDTWGIEYRVLEPEDMAKYFITTLVNLTWRLTLLLCNLFIFTNLTLLIGRSPHSYFSAESDIYNRISTGCPCENLTEKNGGALFTRDIGVGEINIHQVNWSGDHGPQQWGND